MGQVTVSKEITFDCAHMLSGHEALCKNLHGHTYKLQVKITAETKVCGSSACMVIDFKDLKQIIKAEIADKFDHAFIVSSEAYRGEAENALFDVVTKYQLRHYVMPSRTTAENMAIHFKKLIEEAIDRLPYRSDCQVHIRVYETPTSYAEA